VSGRTIILESNHPIATSAGFQRYNDKSYPHPECATWEDWCKWADRVLGFKVDRRPGTSRMIEGVPHFFPVRRKVGIHCIRAVVQP
jgi:hypothetical protein